MGAGVKYNELLNLLESIDTFVGFKHKFPKAYSHILQETQFLNNTAHLRQRIWHITNKTRHPPTCLSDTCSNSVKWHHVKQKHNDFCSVKCANNDNTKKTNIKASTKKKYGKDSYAKTTEFAVKRDQSNMEHWGTTNPNQLNTIYQKRKNTLLQRYGVEAPLQSKTIKNKAKQTRLERYFTDNIQQIPGVIEKTKNTKRKRYGCDNNSQQHISDDVLAKLNSYEWLFDNHVTKQRSCVSIGNELGVYNTTIHRYLHIHNINIRRWMVSSPEHEIHEVLTKCGIQHTTSERKLISPYELDIYIPSMNLAIEYCGLYWHTDRHQRIDAQYHRRKYLRCEQLGVRLITIFEDEWLENKELVTKKILHLVQKNKEVCIYARQTKVVKISNAEKRAFLDTNHIQGNGPGSVSYGLRDQQNNLVAVMTCIVTQCDQYILNRYATACIVPGGFSKLLKHIESVSKWSTIISFADLRWSNGALYDANGFECDKVLSPDYHYVVNNTRKHKFGYRHTGLAKKLAVYDPELSERENCEINGLYRIWDCGKKRYVKRNTI